MEERDRGRSRDAEWQAQTEPRSISSHRDRDKDEENGHVRVSLARLSKYLKTDLDTVFKAPADELDDHDDLTTVPLLASGQGVAPEELDELLRAEGPNTGERGTMMDGIANVGSPSYSDR